MEFRKRAKLDQTTDDGNDKAKRKLPVKRVLVGGLASFAGIGVSSADAGPTLVVNCNDVPKPAGCTDSGAFAPGQPPLGADFNPALVDAFGKSDQIECRDALLGRLIGKDPAGSSLAYRVNAKGAIGRRVVGVNVGMADLHLNGGNMSPLRDPKEGVLFKATCDALVKASVKVRVVGKRKKGQKKRPVLGTYKPILKLNDSQTGFKGTGYENRLFHRYDQKGLNNDDLFWRRFSVKLKRPLAKGDQVETVVTAGGNTEAKVSSSGNKPATGSATHPNLSSGFITTTSSTKTYSIRTTRR